METNTPTIRERVIGWLIDNPGQFTVNQTANDLGLTRRQTLNALHGLTRKALADQLTRISAGLWEYAPAGTVRFPTADHKYDDGRKYSPVPMGTVPLGIRGEVRAIARVGNRIVFEALLDGRPSAIYLIMEQVTDSVEFLCGLGRPRK